MGWQALLQIARPTGAPRSDLPTFVRPPALGLGGSTNVFGSPTAAPKQQMSPIAQGQFGLPFSGDEFPAPKPLTGPESPSSAATNAVGDLYHNVNLGNVVPYTMERFPVIADQFAKDLTGGAIQTPGGINLNPLDAFLGGVKAVSDVVAPVLDFGPNLLRDFNLNQQVANYRAVAQVKKMGGVPNMDLETATNLANATQIPDEVKAMLDANPEMSQAEVDKALDTYGRQWSYDKTWGMPINLLAGAVTYAPELLAGGVIFGTGKAAMAASRFAGWIPTLSKVANGAAAIEKIALGTGAGATALTTALDYVARRQGNQAALDYWNKLNETKPISNDPNVQLVTAFTTNPFTPAIKMLSGVRVPDAVPVFGGRVMGVIPLAKGLGNIYVDRKLGQTIASFSADESKAIRYGAEMYNVSPEVMASHIGPNGWYENVAELNNEILNQGIKAAFKALPEKDRAVFLSMNPGQSIERDQALMTMIAPQLKAALDNRGAIASEFQNHHWTYADMTGAFNPDTMATMAKGYRNASARTYDFRVATNTALGYPNALHPDASIAVRSALDSVAGETVTNEWLNTMKVNYGALRNIGTDLVTPQMVATDAIPKTVVAQILDRGDQKWAQALTHNPIMARSGKDPVLYGDRSLPADYADALGTTPQVYTDAIGTPDGVKDWEGLRKFVADKYAPPKSELMTDVAHQAVYHGGQLTPEALAAKSNEEVWNLANAYVSKTIDPWVAAGARADAATKAYQQLSPQLAERQAAGDIAGAEAIQKQMANLMEDVKLANDPPIPFSQRVSDVSRGIGKDTREAQLTQAAMRKVDAMTRLDELAAIDREASALSEMGPEAFDLIRRARDGDWAWAGKAPVVSDRLYSHLAKFIDSNPGLARMVRPGADTAAISAMGDAELWEMIRTFANDAASSKVFMRPMTGSERRALVNRLATLRPGGTAEDLAARMNSRVAETQARGLTGEEAVAQLGRLKEAREAILDGQTPKQLQHASELRVPQSYVDSAQSDMSQGVVYDPAFLVYHHPENVAKLQNLIASGDVTKDAVLEILEQDPLLMRGLEKLVASREKDLGMLPGTLGIDRYLTDMVNGTSIIPGYGPMGVHSLDALIPKGFVRPTPGVIEVQSAADQAILEANDALLADNLAVPVVPPIEGVPLVQAQKAVGTKRYTSQVAKRLKAAGVSTDSPIDVWGTASVSAVGQTPARFLIDSRGNARVPPEFRPEDGYVYRVMSDGATGAQWDRGVYVSTSAPDTIYVTDPARQRIVRAPDPGNLTEAAGGYNATKNRRVTEPIGPSAQEYLGSDGAWHPVATAVPTAVNKVGADTLSTILWGKTGMPPVTVGGLLSALKEIESGRASAMGLGDGVLAEAQRTGQKVLDSYLGRVEHGEFPPGVFMQGFNPAAMSDEIATFARNMVEKGVIHLDPQLGVAYGLKKTASKELYTSILSVPFSAEEFMSGYFASFEDRIASSALTQALHSFFGRKPNAQIRAEGKARFTQSIINAGGDAELADAIWTKWRDYHLQSQEPSLVKTIRGREYRPGDTAYFADIRNIPNNRLNALVTGFQKDEGVLNPYYAARGVDVPETLRNADFSTMFREASSFTRRNLKGLPLGEQLAAVYGNIAHSSAVTTLYYQFRFALDARFHAMQKFEAVALYKGMAGLRPDEGPALFGMTRDAIARVSDDAMANTGFPFMGNRADYTYKALAKLEKTPLRNEIKALDVSDPKYHDAFQKVLKEMAQTDPELAQTVARFGDTPETYLRAMDDWYGKMLKSSDPEGLIHDAVADATLRDPVMGEIYGRLEQVQLRTLADIRKVIYGNPDRSVFERLMNSYLLFWPISYTFKAAKWWMGVLFDSVGGLPTGAGGAYLLNQAYSAHEKAMKEDPGYASFIASNNTLLFIAQMMFPLNPTDPFSWSLSPIVKDAFFGGTKQLADIGPVYTYTHLLPQATTEVYRQTDQLPIWNQVYPALTGYPKPKQKPKPAPLEPLDTTRWGQ